MANAKPDMCLCLLPNLVTNNTGFPHDVLRDARSNTGVPLQACTVLTYVRVGARLPAERLIESQQGPRLKPGPDGHDLEVTMSVHLAATGREVTNADITGTISANKGKEPAQLFEQGTLSTKRLSTDKPLPESEDDPAPWREGAARDACAAEVEFAFRFKFTPAGNLKGLKCNTQTRVFLRFSMAQLGLHVETEQFRLVAKRDDTREKWPDPHLLRPVWGPPPTVQPSLPVGGNPLDVARTKLREAAALIASLAGGNAGVQEALELVRVAQTKLNTAGGNEQPLAVPAIPMLPPLAAVDAGASSGAALAVLGEGLQALAPSRTLSAEVASLSAEALSSLEEFLGKDFSQMEGSPAAGALMVPGTREMTVSLVGLAHQLGKRISPEGTPGRAAAPAAAAAAAPAAVAASASEEDAGPSSKRQKLATLQRIFKDGLNHHQTVVEEDGGKRLAAIVRNLTTLVKEAKTPQHQVYMELGRITGELNDLGNWLDFVGESDRVSDDGGGADGGDGDAVG